jgi:hypothetical protein
MALTQPKELKKWLKKEDEVKGDTDWRITKDDQAGKLANNLRNLIIRSSTFIIEGDYQPDTIRLVTERLNQLVEQYRTPEFVPFIPQGASHIDFIVIEIPDQNNPDKMIKQLGLEIQLATR